MVKLKIRKYVYLCIFSLTTSQCQKFIPKADFKQECLYYSSTKKWESFRQYLTKSKNGFPIVVSNLARKGSRVYFHARVQIFSPNGLY